jgi:hypothetical protein
MLVSLGLLVGYPAVPSSYTPCAGGDDVFGSSIEPAVLAAGRLTSTCTRSIVTARIKYLKLIILRQISGRSKLTNA